MARTGLLLILLPTNLLSLQTFLQLPQASEVLRGQSLTLGCLVAEKGGECRWEREGMPVGQYDEKYVWAGDREAGDCSLTILDSHPDYDSGWWSCQVSASNITAKDSLISPTVRVLVLAPPTQLYLQDSATGLVLSSNEEITVKQGDYLRLTCVAVGGRPAPSLSWHSNHAAFHSIESDHALSQQHEQPQTNVLLESGDWVASRQLEVEVEAGWGGLEVICVSRHLSQERPGRTGVTLRVLTPPVITDISLTSNQLLCSVEAGDQEVTVSWHSPDQPHLSLSSSPVLDLTSLSLLQSRDFLCVAQNSVGTSEKLFSLEVPVRFTEVTSGPLTASVGSSLELTCKVEASPPASVIWLVRRTEEEEVGRGEYLIIPSVSYSDAGQYYCRASNTVRSSEVTEITSQDIELEVLGGPTVTQRDGGDTVANLGDTVEFKVEFCSNPRSEVQWTDGNGNILAETETEVFSLEPSETSHCYIAKLFLLNVQTFHNGVYILKLENDFGTAEQGFRLSLLNNFLNFEVLVAISCGLILTVIVLMFVIISLCLRHRVKLSESEISSRETDSETYSRDNSTEELLLNIKHDTILGGSSCDQSLARKFNNIYSFPNGGGSLRKSEEDRRDYSDYSSYVHINTNAYSYVSYDDVDKHMSDIL